MLNLVKQLEHAESQKLHFIDSVDIFTCVIEKLQSVECHFKIKHVLLIGYSIYNTNVH